MPVSRTGCNLTARSTMRSLHTSLENGTDLDAYGTPVHHCRDDGTTSSDRTSIEATSITRSVARTFGRGGGGSSAAAGKLRWLQTNSRGRHSPSRARPNEVPSRQPSRDGAIRAPLAWSGDGVLRSFDASLLRAWVAISTEHRAVPS